MYSHESQVRVRYAETDQMGYVYYGRYAEYFEISRAELIRELGYSYAAMEAEGVMMPVTEMRVRYLRPVRYDNLVTLRATIRQIPAKRVTVETQVLNEAGKLCVEGKVTLAFVNMQTGQSQEAPARFRELLEEKWTS